MPGGELELRRALELDPNSALVLIPMAEAPDPFSPDRNVQVGFALLTVGRYQAAIADFRKALETDPHNMTAQLWLAV